MKDNNIDLTKENNPVQSKIEIHTGQLHVSKPRLDNIRNFFGNKKFDTNFINRKCILGVSLDEVCLDLQITEFVMVAVGLSNYLNGSLKEGTTVTVESDTFNGNLRLKVISDKEKQVGNIRSEDLKILQEFGKIDKIVGNAVVQSIEYINGKGKGALLLFSKLVVTLDPDEKVEQIQKNMSSFYQKYQESFN